MATLLNIILVVSGLAQCGQMPDRNAQLANIPDAVTKAISNGPLAREVGVSFHINPFYRRGDFDGDRTADIAVLVKQRTGGKVGIAIIDGRTNRVTILGAGRSFGAGGDDFDWMDYWQVNARGPVQRGVKERAIPRLVGDALLVGTSESASGLIYWNGKRYAWYQQGD